MNNIYIALENVRSLYNVGAIMRTCSFFGFYKLILIGYSGTRFDFKGNKILHSEVAKTALGAEKDIEIIFLENSEELFHFAKEKKLKVVSVEQHEESIKLKDWKLENNSVLVFGNELKGISKGILEISNSIIEIEKIGKKGSLNVTTVVGIILTNGKT